MYKRQVRYSVFIGPSVISIHAPTRGATSKAVGCASTKSNFNPRSHERSDKHQQSCHCRYSHFNPRSHERSDLAFTHCLSACDIFQSTLPREERRFILCRIYQWKIFQSTLPREERQSQFNLTSADIDFNPRSHERSDEHVADC